MRQVEASNTESLSNSKAARQAVGKVGHQVKGKIETEQAGAGVESVVSPARVDEEVEPGQGQGRAKLDERERLIFRYVMGMERGDDELIGTVIARALDDDSLWEMIDGINLYYQAEEGLI